MSDFIDVQDIALRNRIAVDGRVNPTVEDWNDLLTHIDRLEQENAELREALQSMVDGYASYDLVHHTGLTQDECQKIIDLALNK